MTGPPGAAFRRRGVLSCGFGDARDLGGGRSEAEVDGSLRPPARNAWASRATAANGPAILCQPQPRSRPEKAQPCPTRTHPPAPPTRVPATRHTHRLRRHRSRPGRPSLRWAMPRRPVTALPSPPS